MTREALKVIYLRKIEAIEFTRSELENLHRNSIRLEENEIAEACFRALVSERWKDDPIETEKRRKRNEQARVTRRRARLAAIRRGEVIKRKGKSKEVTEERGREPANDPDFGGQPSQIPMAA